MVTTVDELILRHDGTNTRGAPGITGVQTLDTLVAGVESVNSRLLGALIRTGRDLLDGNVLAASLDRRNGSVRARLNIERSRRSDEDRNTAPGWQGRGYLLPHLLPGGEQGLADVGQASVRWCISVVGDNRNPRCQRPAYRFIKRLQINQRHRDTIDFRCYRGIQIGR